MEVVITGAKGFIGKTLTRYLLNHGIKPIGLDKDDDLNWLQSTESIYAIIHLGAITDTTSQDKAAFDKYNLEFSKELWTICAKNRKKFIYASSAATYGDGSQGFSDETENLSIYKPLNLYAQSKHDFDLWAIQNAQTCTAPPSFAGLKFFNVYGNNEGSKGKMASMVYQAIGQADLYGKVRLFKNGEQKRDWVYVGDICKVIHYMLDYRCYGIYNVGSGQARSFNDVALTAFRALKKEPNIEYMDMPETLKSAYQSFSQADLNKLRRTGFLDPMTTLEQGIELSIKPAIS
jgi:ADP-L-glycero-D-manno-heptose 6-epimerase